MWDCEPVLYWRCKINGKMTWRKAKAAYIQQTGLWALEYPRPPEGGRANESEE